jgi:peroxiredoxin
MTILHDPTVLPAGLPSPHDDGAARHLPGTRLPDLILPATDSASVNLSRLKGRTVVYAYPRTGQPDQPLPEEWDAIPGARGCTPQSCAFRDHFTELKEAGADHLFGLSTQDTAYQREAAERLHLPFTLLSDARLELTRTLQLPTFEVEGMTLLKRLTLVIDHGVIRFVFYPVFPPNENADVVLAWLRASRWGNKTLFHLDRKRRMAGWLRDTIAALRR